MNLKKDLIMEKGKRLIRMSLALGLMSFIGLILSDFALIDIRKGIETNLNMEWNLITASSFITLLFIVMSSITILKLSKSKL